jgi:hypothetical protein
MSDEDLALESCIQRTETLAKRDIANYIESVTLEPVSEVESFLTLGKFVEAIGKQVSTMIHESLVVNQ